ncbi:MAG: sigma 54-interacting transcriptional regulator [Myxococcota bacterium]
MSEITSVINDTDLSHRQINLRRIRVEVLDGPDQGKWAEFDHDVLRIGAQEGNHFRITDSTVSRRHAEITRTRDGLVLRDLGSTNGTFVGAVRIREVYLGETRRFRVGKTEMEFTLKDELVDILPAKETRFEGLVGQSVSLREVFSVLERVARTELTVLVTGETGTGKELVSRALHQRSNRKNGPFIVFDCGAIPANLVESELFGHERGAFTGAVSSRAGVFEQAHGGTIFLDELGELPLELQPNLLRVLEQREVRRVGDTRTRAVDVRVVAATNRDLREMVKEGRFREDLYYRLNVVEVKLPPLRQRIEDLPLLVEHIIKSAPFEHSVRGCTDDVLRLFADYHWPGNIRELKNSVLRCIPFCDGDLIDLHSLPDSLRGGRTEQVLPDAEPTEDEASGLPLPDSELSMREAKDQLIAAFERRYLEDLLERCDGNVSKAARSAGVDRKTITRLLKRHDIR